MMHRQTIAIGIVCGITCLTGPIPLAQANTLLTRAEIQRLRNRVELIPNGASARSAQVSDRLVPGDAITTAQQALAELEFNDGTLARLGELALFRFQPDTRTFDLEEGTVLLLIPPGQGTSQLRTPNATAGIRGSGLFGRFIEGDTPDESVTLIGALTTSGIEVATNAQENGGQSDDGAGLTPIELEAGHLAVIVGDRPPQVFSFDLDIFYQTSGLVQGLGLSGDGRDGASIWSAQQEGGGDRNDELGIADTDNVGANSPLAPVQQETQDGLAAQSGTLTQPHVDNPFFIHSAWTIESTSAFSSQTPNLEAFPEDAAFSDSLDNVVNTTDALTPEDIVNVGDGIFDPIDDGMPDPMDDPLPEPPVDGPVAPPTMPDPVGDVINDPFEPISEPLPDVVDPPDPVEPPEPCDCDPGEPAEPAEPADPGDPGEPAEPAEPADPGDPGEPAEPAEPANPSDPGDISGRPGRGGPPSDPTPSTPFIPDAFQPTSRTTEEGMGPMQESS